MSPHFFQVNVPATSANLGPGFDCLALALDLWNNTTFQVTGKKFLIEIQGEGESFLPVDEKNLIVHSFIHCLDYLGFPIPAGIEILCRNNIPTSSGLGSSAAAVLTGLLAANCFANYPLSNTDVLGIALDLEGHPDNISAALLGGLVAVTLDEGKCITHKYEISQFHVAVVLPHVEISTTVARAILPQHYTRQDIVYNLGRVALIIEALCSGNMSLLQKTMRDRLHQPYRLPYIPGGQSALQAAGVFDCAVSLSGAGPGLICFTKGDLREITRVIEFEFQKHGIPSKTWVISPTLQGSWIETKT